MNKSLGDALLIHPELQYIERKTMFSWFKKDQKPIETYHTLNMRDKILFLLQRGEHLSELDGLKFGYGTSFRTRISELRKAGHEIFDYFEESDNGARFKRYYMRVE